MPTSAIIVGVRVRPFNQREIKYKSTLAVDMTGNTTSIASGRTSSSNEKPREFAFDYAFWTHSKDDVRDDRPFADQDYVFDRIGTPVLESALEGFNSCLFAYGQTGSGKTYSMLGTQSDPGILPRISAGLFSEAAQRSKNGIVFKVECSFCEIYNEVCQDLLSTKGPISGGLKVRQDPKKGIFVQGLSQVITTSAEQFDALLDKALNNRAIAATNMNATSSRSHAIILINVIQVEAGTSLTRTSKMSLVDLAGSERAESTGATGSTMKEAQNINYSLSVLGMCLTRLAEAAEAKPGSQKLHVPFRDSSLTWLLSDNLGGNSKTSMIAAISPADVNYEETVSTLRFASVTKRVKTVAVVNESANDKLIRELREELAQLTGTLKSMKAQGMTAAVAPKMTEKQISSELDDGDDPLENDADTNQLQTEISAIDLLKEDNNPNNNNTKLGGKKLELDDSDLDLDLENTTNNNATIVELDWKAPQFLNLSPVVASPESVANGSILSPSKKKKRGEAVPLNAQSATEILQGENTFKLGTATVVVEFSGLTGEVTLKVVQIASPTNEADQVFMNEDTSTPLPLNHVINLRQNDRLICGECVLRFSHYQAVLDAEGKSFRTEPCSERHCNLLESYYRTVIHKEQVDDFMGMLATCLDGAPKALHSTIADILQLLEIDEQMLHSELFMKESNLTEEFPQVDKVEGLDVDFDARAFDKAKSEREAELKRKTQKLQNLKDKISKEAEDAEADDLQNRVFAKTAREAALKQAQQIVESAENEVAKMSEDARAAENSLQESLDEAASERILAVELEYHKEVRHLRQFRPAPTDPEDVAIFKRQATIIQNDARLNIQRCGENIPTCDPIINATDFQPRTICLSKRFMFFFKKLYRREPLMFAIYLPGCTTSINKDPKYKVILDITAAVARSPAPEHQSQQPQLRFAFNDAKEARGWKSWIDANATPVPPLSIWKRLLETEILDRRGDSSSSSVLGQRESEPGKPFEMKGWVPDESVSNCTRCNDKFGFFTRKHHCRVCGEIFCSKCLDAKKFCVTCQETISASPGKEKELEADQQKVHRPERHRIIMKEPVSNFIEGGKYFAFYCRGKIRQFATRRDLDDFAVSLTALEEEEDKTKISHQKDHNSSSRNPKNFKPYLLDLFRGRFHEWCAVDISHVWRCSYHPLAVNLKLREEVVAGTSAAGSAGGESPAGNHPNNNNNNDDSVYSTEPVEDTRPKTYVSVICTSVVDRERLFEGIAMMIGRRGYSPIGQSGVGSNELDILVVAPAAATSNSISNSSITENLSITDAASGLIRSCAVKLTNTLRTQIRIRVSHQVEGAKFHFQQGDFDIIAAVSLNKTPPWTKQYLRSTGMVSLCDPIALSPANSLFVAADEHVAQHVTPPVSANARGICILAFGVHESSILIVASTANDVADFEEVTDEEHSKILQDEVALAEEEANRSNNNKSQGNLTNSGNQSGANLGSGGASAKKQQQQPANNSSPGRASTQPQLGSPNPQDLTSPNGYGSGNDEPASPSSFLPPPNDQKAILFASALQLDKLIMWPIREVDPVEQFENVFVIGHNVQLSGFTKKDKSGIQFKASNEGQVLIESRGHIECSLHIPQHILTSLRMKIESQKNSTSVMRDDIEIIPEHINVKIARLLDAYGVEVHGQHEFSVIVNTPFEKATQEEADQLADSFGSVPLQNAGQGGIAAIDHRHHHRHHDSSSKAKEQQYKVGNTIRLLDRVAEHCSSKNLFVVLRDFGTVTVPFHKFMNQTMSTTNRKTVMVSGVSIMHCGVETGTVDLAISLF